MMTKKLIIAKKFPVANDMPRNRTHERAPAR
jgi:hypothetical protein